MTCCATIWFLSRILRILLSLNSIALSIRMVLSSQNNCRIQSNPRLIQLLVHISITGTNFKPFEREKVATVTVSIEETMSLGQGERAPDRGSYFPKPHTHFPTENFQPEIFTRTWISLGKIGRIKKSIEPNHILPAIVNVSVHYVGCFYHQMEFLLGTQGLLPGDTPKSLYFFSSFLEVPTKMCLRYMTF